MCRLSKQRMLICADFYRIEKEVWDLHFLVTPRITVDRCSWLTVWQDLPCLAIMFWGSIFSFGQTKINRPTFCYGLLWSQANSLFNTARKGNMMKTDLLSNDSSDFHYRVWAFSIKFLQSVLNSLNRFRYTTVGFLGCLKYWQAESIQICPNLGSNLTGTMSQIAKTRDNVMLTLTTEFSQGNCSEKWNHFPKNHSEELWQSCEENLGSRWALPLLCHNTIYANRTFVLAVKIKKGMAWIILITYYLGLLFSPHSCQTAKRVNGVTTMWNISKQQSNTYRLKPPPG